MKYIGSKNKLSKYIAPIIQSYIDKNDVKIYFEPFVGGANMIDKIKCEKRIGNDMHKELIALFKELQNGWIPPPDITKDTYVEIRDNKEKYPLHMVALVGFCASYNSKYFGGYAGKVNTKIGTIRNYCDESIRNLKEQIPKLLNIKFANKNYLEFDKNKIKNCVIYCDPPYANSTEYITNNFNHDEFWDWCRELSKNNIVLISEYNAPDNFECIWQQEVKTHLNNRNKIIKIEKLFKLRD
ncbi:MAG TPA: DNA adenine methylase [Candidatus Paceibacterota bacterium]